MDGEKQVKYPGIPTTADGAEAVVWVDTHITHGACAYPITSSSKMGEGFNYYVANGMNNLWGDKLIFIEPESEHSAATVCEGFAVAGGRITTFTSGQGLVLMKEVLYTISGKGLPIVFHIGARALTSHSLNVHAGHDDVMAVADTGWGMVFGKNAQEAGDLAAITRRAAESCGRPFMNIQDGFLTTHTIESILQPEPELLKEFVGAPEERLRNLFDTNNPIMTGVVQNQDSYMKGKIAQRGIYADMEAALKEAMDEWTELTGRKYDLIEEYLMEDAEYAIVAMGGMAETAMVTADFLRDQGKKVGVVHVTTFRPFPGKELVNSLKNTKAFAVIERMDNPIAQSNPLTAEIKSAFSDALTGHADYPQIERIPIIYSGSAGLGSRDVRPGDLIATYAHMEQESKQRYFALGIKHHLALEATIDPDPRPEGSFSMRGHSVGGFGSVTTNKVIGSFLGMIGFYVQAYPKYGSEKKGLPTTYYLTVADRAIRTHCEMNHVNFVPLNDINAFHHGNPLSGLQEDGMVFVQTNRTNPADVWKGIPKDAQDTIRKKNIRVVALDTVKIAREVAPTADLEMRMQGIVLAGIFLRVSPVLDQNSLTKDQLFDRIEDALRKWFGKRGEGVVQANVLAVKRGYEEVFEVSRELIESTKVEAA
ncbi:MAG: 2-oxoacid:acceptor oxidoreductase family protein [Candidatus Poribacteria bacterium]|nr:2-oxoacid:acceptor oxidoreductase family protein [Candidatus Poribacteria bacterium]